MIIADSYSSSTPLAASGAPRDPQAASVRQDPAAVGAQHDDGLSAFMAVRPRLFHTAYRLLGSTTDAEDLVQDVWMRWQTTDRTTVRDARAFLVTTATRLAINVLRSARVRHETCIDPWLPEPVDTSCDPRSGAERNEALHRAAIVLGENLTAKKRAAFILREAFECSYRDIGQMLRLEEACARQMVTRARRHIAENRTCAGRVRTNQRAARRQRAASEHGVRSAEF